MMYFNSIKVRLELIDEDTKETVTIFQFHKGTIRTWWCLMSSVWWCHFNSIKVRLEPAEKFYKAVSHLDFNSIKVRLEHSPLLMVVRTLTYFNSIKVRLEQGYVRLDDGEMLFQFHKGTIRTQWKTRLT